ncbi:unnamed protein product, partial [Timema podura]|nr:unnamed protein product [Timema podura]
GPFVSALANRYGFRLVTILGSILGTVGFLASSFATDVEFLFVSYGIIGGIGFGLIYVPAVITTGFYFERWRAIATGIAVCGSGIGTFVLAPFAVHLIEWYGWRGALIIQAGLVLNCAIFGTLFRPLEPVRVVTTREVSMKNNHSASKLSLLKRIKQERDEHRRNRGSLASVDSDKYEKSSIRVTNNNAYTTAAEALARSVGTASESSSRSRKGLELSGTKPFYRDDIFFGASLTRLPQYTSQSSISYHMSVTRLPTKLDIKEQAGENNRICTEALTRTLGTMLDFSLFKSPTFLILAVSGFITMMGFYVPFMYLTGNHTELLPDFLMNEHLDYLFENINTLLAQALSVDAAVDIPGGIPVEGPATPADVVCEG